MKRVFAVAAVLLVAFTAVAYQKGVSGRVLTGKVIDRQDNVLPNAVVYLSDSRTRAVKTFIVGTDGAYRFPALSQAVDYEIYAQYNGKKSDTKTLSQFDNRQQVNINLRIDTR
jgi:hypothetical protein